MTVQFSPFYLAHLAILVWLLFWARKTKGLVLIVAAVSSAVIALYLLWRLATAADQVVLPALLLSGWAVAGFLSFNGLPKNFSRLLLFCSLLLFWMELRKTSADFPISVPIFLLLLCLSFMRSTVDSEYPNKFNIIPWFAFLGVIIEIMFRYPAIRLGVGLFYLSARLLSLLFPKESSLRQILCCTDVYGGIGWGLSIACYFMAERLSQPWATWLGGTALITSTLSYVWTSADIHAVWTTAQKEQWRIRATKITTN